MIGAGWGIGACRVVRGASVGERVQGSWRGVLGVLGHWVQCFCGGRRRAIRRAGVRNGAKVQKGLQEAHRRRRRGDPAEVPAEA